MLGLFDLIATGSSFIVLNLLKLSFTLLPNNVFLVLPFICNCCAIPTNPRPLVGAPANTTRTNVYEADIIYYILPYVVRNRVSIV